MRKILGASVQQTVALLSKDFFRLVFIAFIIAIPITWYGTDIWLQTFANRITFNMPAVLITAGIIILITVMTVSVKALKAALGNPIDSLRNE